MRRADQIAGLVGLAFSAAVIQQSLGLPTHNVAAGRADYAPPAGFLPFWAGVVLATLSILLVVSAAVRAGDGPGVEIPQGGGLRAVGVLIFALFLYVATLERLGYIPATILLTFITLRWALNAKWLRSLLLACGITALLYVLFDLALNIDLPVMPFVGW